MPLYKLIFDLNRQDVTRQDEREFVNANDAGAVIHANNILSNHPNQENAKLFLIGARVQL